MGSDVGVGVRVWVLFLFVGGGKGRGDAFNDFFKRGGLNYVSMVFHGCQDGIGT